MRIVGRWLLLTTNALAPSCFEPTQQGNGTDGTTEIEMATTSNSTATSGPDTSDSEGDSTTTSTSEGSSNITTDTGGCTPGVFGQSRFGQACFQ